MLLVATGIAQDPPAGPSEPSSRLPVPNSTDLEAARARLLTGDAALPKSATEAEKSEYLRTLLGRAEDEAGMTRAERHAAYEHCIDLAASVGDVESGLEALEGLTRAFHVDTLKVKVGVLEKLASRLTQETSVEWTAAVEEAVTACFDDDKVLVGLQGLRLRLGLPALPRALGLFEVPSAEELESAQGSVRAAVPALSLPGPVELHEAIPELRLLAEAEPPGSVLRYTLWSEVLKVGITTMSPDLVREAVGELRAFDIDEPKRLREAILAMSKTSTPGDADGLASLTVHAIDRHLADGDLTGADECLRMLRRLQPKGDESEAAPDGATRGLAEAQGVRVKAAKQQRLALDAALKLCNRMQANPAENSVRGELGWILCGRLGWWANGLPLLRQHEDAKLSGLAVRELRPTGNQPEEWISIADEWWAHSQAKSIAVEEIRSIRAHAAYIYEQWLASMKKGVKYKETENRIREGRSGEVRRSERAPKATRISTPAEPVKPAGAPKAARGELSWCEVLDEKPDPRVIQDRDWAKRIEKTKLPWRVRDRKSGVQMLLIPPGKYRRGASPDDGDAAPYERPQHQVVLTRPFYIGRYEVQDSEWRHTMRGSPLDPDVLGPPANNMTMDQIREYLSRNDGLRLPTEAEWEYACRAGSEGITYGPLAEIAWCTSTSQGVLRPVGQLAANALGLHDTLGSVWEIVQDYFSADEYARSEKGVVDPKGPSSGDQWVMRGGSYNQSASDAQCRASVRGGHDATQRYGTRGFRIARDP